MSSKLDGTRKKPTPGPGSYENMHNLHYNKLQGSKMGRDTRMSYFLNESTYKSESKYKSPAPVKYNSIDFAHHTLGRPKYGFGSSTRVYFGKNTSPGPGSYEIGTSVGPQKGVPAYSMPGRSSMRPKTMSSQ